MKAAPASPRAVPGSLLASDAESWLVVVLAHDEGVALIEACLTSVGVAVQRLRQVRPSALVRVCVVDDEWGDTTSPARPLATGLGFDYRSTTGSIARKRNLGLDHAASDFVAFTDADCQVDPDWLVAHSKAYHRSPTAPGVVGTTLFQGARSPTLEAARYCGLLVGFGFPGMMTHAMWGPCSNLSLRAEVLAAVGGFDERFGNAAEDVDLGLRVLAEGGAPLLCLQDAPVQHDVPRFLDGVYRRAFRWGCGEATLLCLHPERHALAAAPGWLTGLTALLLGLALAARTGSVSPLVWFLAVFAVAGPSLEGRAGGGGLSVVWRARLLRALFGVGTLVGLARLGRPSLMFRAMNYGSGQFAHEWPAASRRLWEATVYLVGAACLFS